MIVYPNIPNNKIRANKLQKQLGLKNLKELSDHIHITVAYHNQLLYVPFCSNVEYVCNNKQAT